MDLVEFVLKADQCLGVAITDLVGHGFIDSLSKEEKELVDEYVECRNRFVVRCFENKVKVKDALKDIGEQTVLNMMYLNRNK